MDELIGALAHAIYQTIRGYVDPVTKQRGATALAERLAVNPGTLSNKANPLQDTQLNLAESIPLQLVANDYQILYAYNRALGHCAFQLPAAVVSDVELLDQYACFHAAVGVKAETIRGALADQNITREEVAAIRTQLDSVIRCGLQLSARFEALAR